MHRVTDPPHRRQAHVAALQGPLRQQQAKSALGTRQLDLLLIRARHLSVQCMSPRSDADKSRIRKLFEGSYPADQQRTPLRQYGLPLHTRHRRTGKKPSPMLTSAVEANLRQGTMAAAMH